MNDYVRELCYKPDENYSDLPFQDSRFDLLIEAFREEETSERDNDRVEQYQSFNSLCYHNKALHI